MKNLIEMLMSFEKKMYKYTIILFVLGYQSQVLPEIF